MIRSMKTRRLIIAVGAGLAALVALHPPWIARAVAIRMSFKGFPTVPPTTVVDTVGWAVPFAPIYARPSLSLDAQQFTEYQARLSRGDTSAAREWQKRIEGIERRYRVPDTLRSEWSMNTAGPAPVVAYRRKIVSAQFEVDVARLGVYLLVVVAATTVVALLTSPRASA
jgi:hypothetical protein